MKILASMATANLKMVATLSRSFWVEDYIAHDLA